MLLDVCVYMSLFPAWARIVVVNFLNRRSIVRGSWQDMENACNQNARLLLNFIGISDSIYSFWCPRIFYRPTFVSYYKYIPPRCVKTTSLSVWVCSWGASWWVNPCEFLFARLRGVFVCVCAHACVFWSLIKVLSEKVTSIKAWGVGLRSTWLHCCLATQGMVSSSFNKAAR